MMYRLKMGCTPMSRLQSQVVCIAWQSSAGKPAHLMEQQQKAGLLSKTGHC